MITVDLIKSSVRLSNAVLITNLDHEIVSLGQHKTLNLAKKSLRRDNM
jgi:hypothetical protein